MQWSRGFRRVLWSSLASAIFLLVVVPEGSAQISIGINVGPQPICPYGYYDYAPYSCSPYGYYGSEWFVGGGFLGAGPWFHGPRGFNGHVNRYYDRRFGYRGQLPARGAPGYYRGGEIHGFRGNQTRDGLGHPGGGRGNQGGGGRNFGGGGQREQGGGGPRNQGGGGRQGGGGGNQGRGGGDSHGGHH